ncbi:SurA N-terminal domain-containing protein [Halobacillus sp. H74]|uniref:SurA N-terminal domain-containing protein n=1 Tax=Halobacillus sp. H74 TaxID=3457436 RepID=UPI003FCDA703
MKKTFLIVLIGFLVTIGLAACSNSDDESAEGNNEETEQENSGQSDETANEEEATGPVAVVNGEELSREEFNQQLDIMKQQYEQYGMDIEGQEDQIKQSVVDQMIGAELLSQKAEEADIEISSEEVDQRYEEMTGQFENEEQLQAALDENNTTEEELKEQVKLQMKVDEYIAGETEETEVAEEELQTQYDTLKEQQEDVGSFEEVKPTLEQQLKTQKEHEQVTKLVEKLREEAEVEVKI